MKKLVLALGLLASICAPAQNLDSKFTNPSDESRIQTYWFWLSGQVTKSGIKKDLEAMKNVGIGGVILLNGGLYNDYGDINYGTPQWWDHLSYAMLKADSLGLSFGMYNSDGWSMSGGPWIDIEESMKIVTSKDTVVSGGGIIDVQLSKPDYNTIYHDIAVVAYPALDRSQLPKPTVVSSINVSTPEALLDDNTETLAIFNTAAKELPQVVFDLGAETSLRRIEAERSGVNTFLEGGAIIETSLDGETFSRIGDIHPLNYKSLTKERRYTISFSETKARFVRFSMKCQRSGITPVGMVQGKIGLGDLRFYCSAGVDHWEGKGAITTRIRHDRQLLFREELESYADEILPEGQFIDKDRIIDLTASLDSDHLVWDAPQGEWTLMRVGYTSTLKKNGPASTMGRGYECNKLDVKAVEKHFYGYVGRANELSLKLTGKPISVMQMESWEAGTQNWTAGFEREFEHRNGYSIIPWLPVMTSGIVVDSYEKSNRFLWDLRKTISEMMAENYWGTMHRLCAKHGIKTENEGSGMQQFLYDPINYLQHSDIPMGEFWRSEGIVRADCKNAASIAHIKGLRLAAGEAFTSSGDKLWSIWPYSLKQIGDEAFTSGVNHFVLHCYVHQPYEVGPGITLKNFGNHFQRLNPWFGYMDGWTDYLHRCQSLLQEGSMVTDVCYFTGEGIPGYLGLRKELSPALPSGYDYDGVNLDIVRKMQVEDGRITLPGGLSYALLVVREKKISPEMAAQIRRLVLCGATVVAPKPDGSPSLSRYPLCDDIVRRIADEVWGSSFDGVSVTRHNCGQGCVIWGEPLESILGDNEDFCFKGAERIDYIHRKTRDADIYFLANYNERQEKAECSFRVSGKTPHLYLPDCGSILDTDYSDYGSVTTIPLSFDALGSCFVIFDENPSSRAKAFVPSNTVATLDKGWDIEFTGAQRSGYSIKDSGLFNWLESDTLRYYSGAAVYTNTFRLKEANGQFVIDLGAVHNIAVVSINGKRVANLWKPPYAADISGFVRKGKNTVTVEVVNSAINSLVGDERYPKDVDYVANSVKSFPEWLKNPSGRTSGRTTFVSYQYPMTEKYLEPSGLVGPVRILH